MESASLADAEMLVAMRLTEIAEPEPGRELTKEEQRARLKARMARDRAARTRR